MTENKPPYQGKLEISLFLLRVTVFIVMLAWTIDKIVNPAHGARILEGFYNIGGVGETVIMIMGAVELVIILAFLAGMWKKYTYGFVLILHGLTTFASWNSYIPPDVALTFFAAWPMLAAAITLYLLRDLDVKFVIGKKLEVN